MPVREQAMAFETCTLLAIQALTPLPKPMLASVQAGRHKRAGKKRKSTETLSSPNASLVLI